MNIWLVADTHFGHTILQKYSDRPVNADVKMMKSFRCCLEEDVLLHLGDVCIGNDNDWHVKLREVVKSKMILLRGNHDKRSISWYLERGWDAVMDRMDIVIYGKRIAFSHIPLKDDGSFDINIHGHFHNIERTKDIDFLCSDKHKLIVMEHTYRPITLKSLVQ